MFSKQDIVIEFYRASGPGGQRKNKKDTAVRLTHVPTGVTVVAPESRYRSVNIKRAFERLAERVDFITTPGYIDGPGAREKWGLPAGTGPSALITNKAVMRFDEKTKEAYLVSYHPGSTVEEIRKNTPWDLKISPDVHETEPPRAEELRVMREILDPHRMIKIYEKRGYV